MVFLRASAVLAVLALAGCSSNTSEAAHKRPKAIVGGTLIDGTGRPPVADAVVLIEEGKILVATASRGIAIPENAEQTNASGLFITPSQQGGRLEYGAAADLYLIQGNPLENPLLLGNPMRVMKTGEWLDASQK